MKTLAKVSTKDLSSEQDWDEFAEQWLNGLREVPYAAALFHLAAVQGRQQHGYLPDDYAKYGLTLPEDEEEKDEHYGKEYMRSWLLQCRRRCDTTTWTAKG